MFFLLFSFFSQIRVDCLGSSLAYSWRQWLMKTYVANVESVSGHSLCSVTFTFSTNRNRDKASRLW